MSSLADEIDLAISRRDVLRLAGAAAVSGLMLSGTVAMAQTGKRAKRVIVVGAGIGGLCCAFELMERGHEVTVLEASGRAGGHVKTWCGHLRLSNGRKVQKILEPVVRGSPSLSGLGGL